MNDGLYTKIKSSKGDILLKLEFEKTPGTVGNFVALAEGNHPLVKDEYKGKRYYDGITFHRVVNNFMIQGGNSDDIKTARKRSKIGKYLLPPDTKRGFKHNRGVISMPSSEIRNPHKLASPYEFFIVQQKLYQLNCNRVNPLYFQQD